VALAHEDMFGRLLACVRWLLTPDRDLYLRQIDVPGADTKFIERHRAILSESSIWRSSRSTPRRATPAGDKGSGTSRACAHPCVGRGLFAAPAGVLDQLRIDGSRRTCSTSSGCSWWRTR
jgi:hypothetical protein